MRGNRQYKIDANHKAVADALRAVGASVQSLAVVGGGAPDILAGARGKNFLFEVKDCKAPPSKRRLTKDELRWHNDWRGQVVTVDSPEEAIAAFLILTLGNPK